MDASHPGATRKGPGGRGPELSAREAQQGVKTGHMRWVLAISTVVAILALGIAWLVIYHPGPSAAVTAPPAAEAPQPPLSPRDQTPATTPPTPAGPRSPQPLP